MAGMQGQVSLLQWTPLFPGQSWVPLALIPDILLDVQGGSCIFPLDLAGD